MRPMVNRWTVAAGLGGIVLGAAGAAAIAQDGALRGFGFLSSHRAEETYDVELGITSTGRPGLPQRQREARDVVLVPAHYGELFQITQDGRDAVLWYRAADGTIRNAVLDAVSSVRYEIQRREATRFEVKLR